MSKIFKVCLVVLMYPIIVSLVLTLFGLNGTMKLMANKKVA